MLENELAVLVSPFIINKNVSVSVVGDTPDPQSLRPVNPVVVPFNFSVIPAQTAAELVLAEIKTVRSVKD